MLLAAVAAELVVFLVLEKTAVMDTEVIQPRLLAVVVGAGTAAEPMVHLVQTMEFLRQVVLVVTIILVLAVAV
jgi:hypothetical protein